MTASIGSRWIPKHAGQLLACLALQMFGAAVALLGFVALSEISGTIACLHQERLFRSLLDLSVTFVANPRSFVLGLLCCGHIAPAVVMWVAHRRGRPISLVGTQAMFTGAQTFAIMFLWVVTIYDVVRTFHNVNCFCPMPGGS